MRRRVIVGIALVLLAATLPLLARCGRTAAGAPVLSAAQTEYAAHDPNPLSDVFTLYDESTHRTLTVPDDEFLAAAVVCEMPLTYADEALRAQAVAAYTVYDYQRAARRAAGRRGADFTCRSANWLIYTTPEQMRARWGNRYAEYQARLDRVLHSVRGQRLTYGGARVLAVYSALSAGTTDAAADVWGGALPYLVPVDSAWDCAAPDFETIVSVSAADFRTALFAENASCNFSGAPAEWLGAADCTASGLVRQMQIGGQAFGGETLRVRFALRSAHFTLTWNGTDFEFVVHGYGHGVGMSQYGANAMAQSGADYRTILAHYYPGTELTDSKTFFCANS